MAKSLNCASHLIALAAVVLLLSGCGSAGKKPSKNATLSALALSAGTLAPGFDADTTAYTVAVGLLVTGTTLTPEAADAGASIEVDGIPVDSGSASQPIALSTGPTPVLVVVTAADGTTQRTYTVVVTRNATVMQEGGYLKASNAEADDRFGISVAISGDTLVVGAYREDASASGGEGDNSERDAGAAYVFTRAGSVWSQQAYLKASNAEAGDEFGFAVAIDGDTLAVSARFEGSSASGGEADNSAAEAGAAYLFTRTGTAWSQQAYLKASNAKAGDWFGQSISLSGDSLVVGAIFEDSSAAGGESDTSAPDAGAAYVFGRTGSTWSQEAYLKASNAEGDDHFGWSVSISGHTVVVGAFNEDSSALGGEADNSEASAGAAYVFGRTGSTWSQQAYLKASNAGASDSFGSAVSVSGETLVVCAFGEASSAGGGAADNSAPFAGAAYVFTRTGSIWSQESMLKASNAEERDLFGGSVVLVGDTLVVGAIQEDASAMGGEADNSTSVAGAAYVYTRSGTTWSQMAYLKASNAKAADQFGQMIALSLDTLVVGAVFEDSSATGGEADVSAPDAGAAYVLR